MTERFDLLPARLNLGLSQRALALECGVSLTTIQGIEAGKSASPKNAKKIADFFGIQVTDLIPVDRQAA